MPMHLESFIPCPLEVEACVQGKEEGEAACCPQQMNPRIISPNSSYVATFDWTATGGLFDLLPTGPGGATWELSVMMENLGGNPDVNIPTMKTLTNHSGQGAYTDTVIFPNPSFIAGQVLRPIFKFHLSHNGVLVVCGFSEGETIHISEG